MSKRTITIEDLFRIRLLGDPQISPSGKQIVFVNKWIDPEKNNYFSNLWMVTVEEGKPTPFTFGEWSDSRPRWSPDGQQIAFTSNRQKPKTQIYLIPVNGGEARPLTQLEEGAIGEIVWSPDGKKIAFTYREVAPEWREAARKERQEKGFSNPPRVATCPAYRLDGDGYYLDQRFHIYVVDVETGATNQLTEGKTHTESDLTWSPDSQCIAFISNRKEKPELEAGMDDIWLIPAEGGEIQQIEAPVGPKGGLCWSPNGNYLAYAGTLHPEDSWGVRNVHVWVIPSSGGEARNLTEGLDNSVGVATLTDVRDFGGAAALQWGSDNRSIYFLVSEYGNVHLYQTDAMTGDYRCLTEGEFDLSAFSVSKEGDVFAFALGTPTKPHEVYSGRLVGGRCYYEPRTDLNGALKAEVEIVEPEQFTVIADDGVEVHGWIVRPPDFEPDRRYPTILMIHGGPHAMYGNCFFHEFQATAAQGYVVAYTNPRGSKGYGEAFAAAIKGDWGNRDFKDLMSVTDYLVSLPYVDPNRMGVAGGSYGGYMTNWIVGHTDRFKAAITDRSVVNLVSMGGTSDFPFITRRYWPGSPWAEPEKLWERSPLAYAANIKTPLLIIHSEGDLRCNVEQADQLYSALQTLGCESIYVRYPVESSHGLSRSGPPDLRKDRLERYLAWWKEKL